MNYQCKQGETFTDFVLNSCGDIAAWSDCLNENFQNSWTPPIFSGQNLSIPLNTNTNQGNILSLAEYPANNYSVPDIYDQIDALFASMEGLTPIPSINILPTLNDQTFYSVRQGEGIGDVTMNSSGDFQNLDLITQYAFFDTWTPILYNGQQIPIPSTINLNSNNYRALNTYPANNFSVPDIYNQIDALFASMDLTDRWILRFGYWLDSNNIVGDSLWEDTDHWIDG